MDNKERICLVKVKIDGLYKWGEGFTQETLKKWRDFWYKEFPKKPRAYWRLVVSRSEGSCDNLISTSSNVYLHPMGFDVIMKSCGGCSKKFNKETNQWTEEYFGEAAALEEIVKEMAEYCGCTYSFQRIEKEVTF